MIRLSGADLVLPDRVLAEGTLTLEDDRIVDVAHDRREPSRDVGRQAVHFDLSGHYIVPGFIDVHLHGVEGTDTLEGPDAIRTIAGRLPKYGVTAFCPTSLACAPGVLATMLEAVREARTRRAPGGARVLPAHLESNFINPEYKGAQPLECLRLPRAAPPSARSAPGGTSPKSARDSMGTQAGGPRTSAFAPGATANKSGEWTGEDILHEIANARPDVGIVTVACELEGGIELIESLAGHGHHLSLGHSGATYAQALDGIRAGARQATHLFNRMPPLGHRAPGLTGAVLESDDVIAELICDGVHVHPAMMRVALASKRPDGIMAITDATAGAGLPPGSRAKIGDRPIRISDAAYLDDGTFAGSVLTMDRAFAKLTAEVGLSLSEAATVCSTTPARALNLQGFGVIARGAMADLVVLDRDLRVVQTWIAGTLAWGVSSTSV
jgi:N-acetylglucosamine-6-phosphate deacetylase